MEATTYDPNRPRGRGAPLDAQQTSAHVSIHVYNRFTDEPVVGAAVSIVNAAHLSSLPENVPPTSRPQSGVKRPQSAKNAGSAFNGNTVTNEAGWAYCEVLAGQHQYQLTCTCTGFSPFGALDDEEVLILPEPGGSVTCALGLVPSPPGTRVTVRLLHPAKPMSRQADPIAAAGQRISIPEIYGHDGDVMRVDHVAVPIRIEHGSLVVDHRNMRVGEYGTDEEGHSAFYGLEPVTAVLSRSAPKAARASPLLVGAGPPVVWNEAEEQEYQNTDNMGASARLLQKLIPPAPPPEPPAPQAADKLSALRRSYYLHNHIGIGSFRVSMGNPALQVVAVASVVDSTPVVDPRSVHVLPVLEDGYAPLEIYAASMPAVGTNANRYMYDAREVVGPAIYTDNTAGTFVARGGTKQPESVQVYVRQRAFVDIQVFDLADNNKDVGRECGFRYSIRRLSPGNIVAGDDVPELAHGRLGDPKGPVTYMSPGFEYLVTVEVSAPYAPVTLRQQRLATWKQEPMTFSIPSRKLVDITITVQDDTPGSFPLPGVGLIIHWSPEDKTLGSESGGGGRASSATSGPLSPTRQLPDRLWLTTDAQGRAVLSLPGGSYMKIRADVFPGQYEPSSTNTAARLNHAARQNVLMVLQATGSGPGGTQHRTYSGNVMQGQVSPMRRRPSSSNPLQPSYSNSPSRPSSSPARSTGSPAHGASRKMWNGDGSPGNGGMSSAGSVMGGNNFTGGGGSRSAGGGYPNNNSGGDGYATNTSAGGGYPTNATTSGGGAMSNMPSAMLSLQQGFEVVGNVGMSMEGLVDRQLVAANPDALVKVYDAVTCEQIHGAAFSVAIRRKYRPILTTDENGSLVLGGTILPEQPRGAFNSDPLRGVLVGDPQRSTFITDMQISNFVTSAAVTKILELDDKHTRAAAANNSSLIAQQERHNALQRRYTDLELEYRRLTNELRSELTELREGLDDMREERNLDRDDEVEPQRTAKVRVLRDRFETFRTHVTTFIQQQRSVGKELEGRHTQLIEHVDHQNQSVMSMIEKMKNEDMAGLQQAAASAQASVNEYVEQQLRELKQHKTGFDAVNSSIAQAVKSMQESQDAASAQLRALLPGAEFRNLLQAQMLKVVEERIKGVAEDIRKEVQAAPGGSSGAPLDSSVPGQLKDLVASAMDDFKKQADAVQATLNSLVSDEVKSGVAAVLAKHAAQLQELQALNEKMAQAADSAAVAAEAERARLQVQLEGLADKMSSQAQRLDAAAPQVDAADAEAELEALDALIRDAQDGRDALRGDYQAESSMDQISGMSKERDTKASAIRSKLSKSTADAEATAAEAMAAIEDAQSQHWANDSEEAIDFEKKVSDFAAAIRQLAGSDAKVDEPSATGPDSDEDEEARGQRQRLTIKSALTATVAALKRAANKEQDTAGAAAQTLLKATLDKAKDIDARNKELEELFNRKRALEAAVAARAQGELATAAAQLAKAAATPSPAGLNQEQLDLLRSEVEEWASQRLTDLAEQVEAVTQASRQVVGVRQQVEAIVQEQVDEMQAKLMNLLRAYEEKLTAHGDAVARLQDEGGAPVDSSAIMETLRQEVSGLVEQRLSGSTILATLRQSPEWIEPLSNEVLEEQLRVRLEEQMRGMYADLSRVIQRQLDKALAARNEQLEGGGSGVYPDVKAQQVTPQDYSAAVTASYASGTDLWGADAMRREMKEMLAQERASMMAELRSSTTCPCCQNNGGASSGGTAREPAGLSWTLMYWGFTGTGSNSKRAVTGVLPADVDVRVTLHLVHPYYEDQQHAVVLTADWADVHHLEFAAIRDPDASIFWQRRDATYHQFWNESTGHLHMPMHKLARLQPEQRTPVGSEICRERVTPAELQRRRGVISAAAGVVGVPLTPASVLLGATLPNATTRLDGTNGLAMTGALPLTTTAPLSAWNQGGSAGSGQPSNVSSLSQMLEACLAQRHDLDGVAGCHTCQQAAEPLLQAPAGGWTVPPSEAASGMSTPLASRSGWINTATGGSLIATAAAAPSGQFTSQRVRRLQLGAVWVLEHVANGGGELPGDLDVFTWCLAAGPVVHLRQLVRAYFEAVYLLDRTAAKLEELQRRIRASQKQTQQTSGSAPANGGEPASPALQQLLDRRAGLAAQLGELLAFERELGAKLGPRGAQLYPPPLEAPAGPDLTSAPLSPRLLSRNSSRSMSPMPMPPRPSQRML